MILFSTYSADSIKEITDAFNHLHRNLTRYEKMSGGRQSFWYEDNIMERRITHMILNSILYLHQLQMKYMDAYKDLISKLYGYVDAICILSTV